MYVDFVSYNFTKFISSNRFFFFFWWSLQDFLYLRFYYLQAKTILLFLFPNLFLENKFIFIYFSCPISLVRISSTLLNSSGERRPWSTILQTSDRRESLIQVPKQLWGPSSWHALPCLQIGALQWMLMTNIRLEVCKCTAGGGNPRCASTGRSLLQGSSLSSWAEHHCGEVCHRCAVCFLFFFFSVVKSSFVCNMGHYTLQSLSLHDYNW